MQLIHVVNGNVALNYMNPIKQNILKVFSKEPTNLDELGRCIVAVLRNKRIAQGNDVVGLAWDITYTPHVSITHDAPYGVKTQWNRAKGEDLRTQPGWTGRVWIRFKKDYASFGSEHFPSTLSYTGTGGAGSYGGTLDRVGSESVANAHYLLRCKKAKHPLAKMINEPTLCSWDYKIFSEDWPGLVDVVVEIQQAQLMNTLANNNAVPVKLNHKFFWKDEVTKQADEEFIAEFLKLVVCWS